MVSTDLGFGEWPNVFGAPKALQTQQELPRKQCGCRRGLCRRTKLTGDRRPPRLPTNPDLFDAC